MYPIVYKPSFTVFWGLSLGSCFLIGDQLTLAFVAFAMLVLITHEHAHIRECQRLLVPINSVTFSWLGGAVDADIRYAKDAVPILSAGVKDTGAYAFVFGAFLAALYFIRPIGMNFAQNPYLNLLNSIVVLTVLMFITNILPIVYHSKTDGIISTDGWGALRFAILRDELWNDGRSEAMMVGVDEVGIPTDIPTLHCPAEKLAVKD